MIKNFIGDTAKHELLDIFSAPLAHNDAIVVSILCLYKYVHGNVSIMSGKINKNIVGWKSGFDSAMSG